MPARLKLGLVGAGPVARKFHVPAIRAVPEIVPYLVADLDEARAQEVAALAGFAHVTTRAEDLCGAVDLAILALPNVYHATVACKLLEAGVAVLCEKPL